MASSATASSSPNSKKYGGAATYKSKYDDKWSHTYPVTSSKITGIQFSKGRLM